MPKQLNFYMGIEPNEFGLFLIEVWMLSDEEMLKHVENLKSLFLLDEEYFFKAIREYDIILGRIELSLFRYINFRNFLIKNKKNDICLQWDSVVIRMLLKLELKAHLKSFKDLVN